MAGPPSSSQRWCAHVALLRRAQQCTANSCSNYWYINSAICLCKTCSVVYSGDVSAGSTATTILGACPVPGEEQQAEDQDDARAGASSTSRFSSREVEASSCSHVAPAAARNRPGSDSAVSAPCTTDFGGPAVHASHAKDHLTAAQPSATEPVSTGTSACVTRGASCQPGCSHERRMAEGGRRPPSPTSMGAPHPLEPRQLLVRTYVALKVEAETEAGEHLTAPRQHWPGAAPYG